MKALDLQIGALNVANDSLNRANEVLSKATALGSEANQKVIDAQHTLAGIPPKVLHEVCHNETKWVLVFLGGFWETVLVCNNEEAINQAWTDAANVVHDLQTKLNSLTNDVQQAALRQSQAVKDLALAESEKAIKTAAKTAAEATYTAAQLAADAAQKALDEAKIVAEKIPFPSIKLSKPGQWKPESVTLIVNGKEFVSKTVNVRLRKGNATWKSLLKPLPPWEEFARGLRVTINPPSKHSEEFFEKLFSEENTVAVTTAFKNLGISGWKSAPIPTAEIIGVLKNPRSAGEDGYVSLDLQLESLLLPGTPPVQFDDKSGIRHNRFIRIEYKHRQESGIEDNRFNGWNVEDRFQIKGRVRWDTDRPGFYEIHPSRAADVKVLPPAAAPPIATIHSAMSATLSAHGSLITTTESSAEDAPPSKPLSSKLDNLVVVQRLDTGAGARELSLQFKGDKCRMDITPLSYSLFDTATGNRFFIDKSAKTITVEPAAQIRATAESVRKLLKTKGVYGTPLSSKLRSTGRTATINGYATEEFVCELPMGRVGYWVAKSFSGYREILDRIMRLQSETLGIDTAPLPRASDFSGMPIRTVIEIDGETQTSTLSSVSSVHLDDKLFTLPADFNSVNAP